MNEEMMIVGKETWRKPKHRLTPSLIADSASLPIHWNSHSDLFVKNFFSKTNCFKTNTQMFTY